MLYNIECRVVEKHVHVHKMSIVEKKNIKIDNWKYKQIGFIIKNLLKKYMRKSHLINIALRENGSI